MSNRNEDFDDRIGNYGIFVLNTDGTELQTWAQGNYPIFSPDGSKIAFIEGGDLWVMDSEGSNKRMLVSIPPDENAEWYQCGDARWSPNGSMIAIEVMSPIPSESRVYHNKEIYLVNADGTGLKNITNNLAHDTSPIWSPDGDMLAFQTSTRKWGEAIVSWEIYVMYADGSRPSKLPNPTNGIPIAWMR